jgi:hypothetical protein
MFNIFCCKKSKKDLNERLFNEECPICLDPLNKYKTITIKKCDHIFHRRCLKEHYVYNGYYCPLCMSMDE